MTDRPCSTRPPNEGLDAVSGHNFQHTVCVRNPQGFHMRPVTAFAELARRYQSAVTVSKDGRTVDGKSPLELLFLAAVEGSELRVEVSGPDAQEALGALVELLERVALEDDDPETPLPRKG